MKKARRLIQMTLKTKKPDWIRYRQHIDFWESHGYEITFEMVDKLAQECGTPRPDREDWEDD